MWFSCHYIYLESISMNYHEGHVKVEYLLFYRGKN